MNIQWLKLDVNILDNQKIKLIRKYPDGDKIIVLWVGLMCMGMKSDEPGIVKIADGLPYTNEELSTILEIPVKTVQLGIELFLKYGMIQATEGGLIQIVDFRKYQSIDRIEYQREQNRARVAKYRSKTALIERR
jgi:predicted phage replisome organizer